MTVGVDQTGQQHHFAKVNDRRRHYLQVRASDLPFYPVAGNQHQLHHGSMAGKSAARRGRAEVSTIEEVDSAPFVMIIPIDFLPPAGRS